MMSIITKTYPSPDFNKKEILRYAGAKEASPEIDALLEECLKEADGIFTYKVCYGRFPLLISGDEIDLTFTKTISKDLAKCLKNSDSFILFGATIGIGLDRLIAKYSKISPSKALMFQAIGTERIESLCDKFCKDIKEEFPFTTPRFSPGYGDLALEIQKDFFAVLEPGRKIGLTLNKTLIMTPSKSVTAIVGISNCNEAKEHNCNKCNKENCLFRR
ncbi:MAG: Vitamin B12 dependent methionine synthase activation subunit [Clostridia bacterium]|nr:Vitamin B12 dependent methionine synthase activation subunit [Clostridia bacterium]